MTLPELLISITLTGILIASLAMSITVIYKQSDNTTGRTNNARSEQNVNVWLPSDLSSAETVSTDPAASPCSPSCPPGANVGGTNALMLTWTGSVPGPGGVAVPTVTKASYRYVLVGTEYQMIRVECTTVNGGSPTCVNNVVLHGLDPPPIGTPYIVGQTKPTWIMVVSQALDPGDTSGSTPAPTDPTFKTKNGQRIVVTINGGGDAVGIGGGKKQISLTAGGTDRKPDLATNSVSFNQTLTAARTRCGGNFGMVIDISGSINRADPNNMNTVRAAITSMIDTFAGTPVKLELTKFGWVGAVLGGAAPTGARYFDMLKETDVSDLKVYLNGGTTSTGVVTQKIDSVNDATNWEDGLYRAFRNTDGTIQSLLPSKVIFFTDGVPSYDRLGGVSGQSGSTASPAGASFPDDTGLGQPDGSGYWQRSWNRANRIAREFGVQVDYIGVFVGSDTTASSSWTDVNAGYQLVNWQKWYHDVWEKGYHDDWQRANNVIYQQGYHLDWQRANNIVYQQGYHTGDFQIASTGAVTEQKVSGNWVPETLANYLANNTNNGSGDNHRLRIPNGAVLGGWTSITLAQYTASNVTASDGTDGVQIGNGFFAPYTSWQTTTQAAYLAGNTATGGADGWQTIISGVTQTPWTSVSAAEYTLTNTTANDGLDGYQVVNILTAPYTLWQNSTLSAYTAGNVDSGTADGWKTALSGASATPYTPVTQAVYDASNTTPGADATDGWKDVVTYTAPYSSWEPSTQAAYTSAGGSSNPGYRTYRSYTAPFSASENTTQALYIANKTAIDPTNNSDGWSATKLYEPPYTGYDATRTYTKTNRKILGDLIDPSGIVDPIKDAGGNVINAEVANMYTTTAWSDVQAALKAIALGQCGGTVTLQTRVNGTTPANDTFTYKNTLDNTKVETSGSKRSGTFDFAIPSGGSITAEIQQSQTTTLVDHYTPASPAWTCKAGGVPITPTIVDVPGTPWDTIRLNVAANQAVSCIQNVTFTP